VIEPLCRRALRALARLSEARPERLRVVVLSGRIVGDVASRVRVGGIEYLGDHGLQGATLARRGRVASLVASTDPAFAGQHAPAEILAAGVAAELGSPAWLFVERKGPSVAFHVRQADDVPAARAAVLEAIRRVEARERLDDHGLAPYRGRSVVDLRPRLAGGKREAVELLVARHEPGAVLVLGDELSDVDAFDALIDARRVRPNLDGRTVAVHGPSRPAPADLIARADLTVRSPHEVGRLLSALARKLRA